MFHRDVQSYKTHIEELLKTDFSFCYYMVHGGTNFGFMNGSNTSPKHEVWPVVTSYDYGAPIDEGGNRTPLYDSLRAVYQRVTNTVLPEVPGAIASMKIDKIALHSIPVFETLSFEKLSADTASTFEQLGQGYGYLVYYNLFVNGFKGKLSTAGIGDYALIYADDSLVYTIDRSAAKSAIPAAISLDIKKHGTLYILFENMGRFNFGKKLLQNSKGAAKGILLNGKAMEWPAIMYKLPMDSLPDLFVDYSSYKANQPIYYAGTFTLKRTADTYLDMRGFGKGVVFVNGHNLGRFWEIGPQYSLYVPGVWLKQGENEIVIFDELNHKQMLSISATAKPIDR
jgi:beta-galactosidase